MPDAYETYRCMSCGDLVVGAIQCADCDQAWQDEGWYAIGQVPPARGKVGQYDPVDLAPKADEDPAPSASGS